MTSELVLPNHPGHPVAAAEDAARSAIRRLIDAWGFSRDARQWESLADTFHPDGTIAVSWYSGPFSGFVDVCRTRQSAAFSKHVMAGSRVELLGSRALAETDVLLFMRGLVDGVEMIGQTNMRFLDCIEQRGDDVWRILDRVALYDHDMILPAVPDKVPLISDEELEGDAPGHRFLAWRLRRNGRTVPSDLFGLGSEREAELQQKRAAWLKAG